VAQRCRACCRCRLPSDRCAYSARGYAYNENPVRDVNTFFNVAASLAVRHVLRGGASLGVTDHVSLDVSFARDLQAGIAGPLHVPAIGPLAEVTSISSEVAANAFDMGLAVRY